MSLNRDIAPLGRLLVAGTLVYDGAQGMINREIYGRLRGAGIRPSMTGWPVFVLGLAEFLVGVYLIYRLWRRYRA